MPRQVVVSAAVIEQDGSFLLARRPPWSHLAGCWEFPGGKCRDDESHQACLRREIEEELGVLVEVGELVYQTVHDYPDRRVELHFYRCKLRGEPRPVLGQELTWVRRKDLAALPLPPADAGLVGKLMRLKD